MNYHFARRSAAWPAVYYRRVPHTGARFTQWAAPAADNHRGNVAQIFGRAEKPALSQTFCLAEWAGRSLKAAFMRCGSSLSFSLSLTLSLEGGGEGGEAGVCQPATPDPFRSGLSAYES